MNLKIALAAAILLTGGAYVSDAQQKNAAAPATAATVNAKAAFNNKIKAYEQAPAADQAVLLEGMKHDITDGIAAAKKQIMMASESVAQQKAAEQHQIRVNSYNDIIKFSRTTPAGKAEILTALKKYAATL